MNHSVVLKILAKEKGEMGWAAIALDAFLMKIKKGRTGLIKEFLSEFSDPLPLAEIKDLLNVVRIAEIQLDLENPIRKIVVLVQQLFELFLKRTETFYEIYVLKLEQVLGQLFQYTIEEVAEAFVETLWLKFPQSSKQMKKYQLQSLFHN